MDSQAALNHCRSFPGEMRFFCMAVALLFFTGGCEVEDPSIVQGYVEGEFVYVASPFGGRLERLSVSRGDHV